MLRKRRHPRCHTLGDNNTVSLIHWKHEDNSVKMYDNRSENLLMIAAKTGNLRSIDFLLSKNVNVNHMNALGETASDIAWTNMHLDVLIELLKNDAPFPKTFIERQVESEPHSSQLKILIRNCKSIHDAIENNCLDELQVCIENRKLKFAYDKNNQCALTTAIKAKKFEAYSFLRSKGFADGIDFYLDFHLQKLDKNEKNELRRSNLKYFHRNINQHVMDLVSKSRLAFESDQYNFLKIYKWFEILDGIPEIRPILKIVASSDKTDIVFDFKSDSVEKMDPTGSEYVNGRTYNKSGNIFIGAGRENDREVLGTLAHELTHFSLQLVYNNDCLPFYWDDESRENEFEAIVETYDFESCRAKNYIIANAFSHDSIENKMRELIVRVPHLVALHSHENEVLTEIIGNFRILFDFFKKKTLPDLKKEENLVKPKHDIRIVNNYFGVYAKAINSKCLSPIFSRRINLTGKMFIESSVPKLVLESLVKQMKYMNANEINSNNVFINFEQMLKCENLQKLTTVAESEVEPTIFIIENSYCVNNVISDELRDVFNKFKIVFITKNKNSVFRKFFLSEIHFDFKWNDFHQITKSKILSSKVVFQDFEVVFNEIVSEELLRQCETSIKLILKPSKLKLQSFSKTLPSPPRVFIERTFQFDEVNSSQHLKSENLCDILQSHRTILISDAAGMGKSTSAAQIARELKQRNQLSWVIYIDLKQHIAAFLRDGQQQPESIDSNFIATKLLNLKSAFEQKLFEDFFNTKKVIFIIDGFDEISPDYKKFVIKILKSIKSSGNQLLVTTRPHLVEELKGLLQTGAIKLMPFTVRDQREFLTKFWQLTSESRIRESLKTIIFGSSWESGFYSTPIHIVMLAEVFEGPDQENLGDVKLDIYSLYKRFFTIKLNIWISRGPLASDDNACIQQSNLNLHQIFTKLALEQLFDADDLNGLNLPAIAEDIMDEAIARVGIVTFSSIGTKQFAHRTFAEYFVADYILFNISKRKPKKPILRLLVKSLVIENFNAIRKFLNDGLYHCENKLNNEVLSRIIKKSGDKIFIVRERHSKKTLLERMKEYLDRRFSTADEEKRSILGNSVAENHAHLMAFILKNMILGTNVKVLLVKNVLFQAVKNIKTSTVIWNCVQNFAKDVQKDILFDKDGNENILWRVVISDYQKGGNCILRHFLEVATNLLNEEEFLKLLLGEGNERFRFYEASGYNGVLGLIWEAAKRKLSSENLKKLAIGSDEWGNTIPNSFHGELLPWLEDVKTLLSDIELSELLTASNKFGEVMFTYALENSTLEDFKKLWKFVEENVTEAGRRKLIFNEDHLNRILIELSIKNQDTRVTDFIFGIQESLTQEEGKDIITYFKERDQLVDFIFGTAIWSPPIFEKISSKLESDELLAIFLSKTSDEKNILHHMLRHRNKDDKSTVWNLIIDKINDVGEVRNLLFEVDSSFRQNVFHLAAKHHNIILIEILNWCMNNFCHQDFKNIFLEKHHQNGFTLMHQWCATWDENFVKIGLVFVEENFSSEERDLIFSLKDNRNRTPRIVHEASIRESKFKARI